MEGQLEIEREGEIKREGLTVLYRLSEVVTAKSADVLNIPPHSLCPEDCHPFSHFLSKAITLFTLVLKSEIVALIYKINSNQHTLKSRGGGVANE